MRVVRVAGPVVVERERRDMGRTNHQAALEIAGRHGGRLAEVAAALPGAPRPWLDLSTGVNPAPWRGARAPVSALGALPDPADTAALEAAAAAAFGVDPACVAATPGAEAALRLLPRQLGAASVDIAAPTYGGHEDAARAAGVPVRLIPRNALSQSDAALLVVVNPNNPDGARTSPATLADLARGPRWLVVDESFVETDPALSVAAAPSDRLIVLRSFGKFYGLPGVRLGFVIASPPVISAVRASFGDWPVCADAVAMGRAAYADADWRARARERLAADARRLDRLLAGAGFEVVGGADLFRLTAAADAPDRFARLCEAGVLTRPFAYEPTWLRFGLPPARSWRRLTLALESLAR